MTDAQAVREDLQLLARAVQEHWPIPEAKRPEVVTKLLDLALGDGHKDRVQVAALRTIMAMSRVNQRTIDVTIKANDYEIVGRDLAEMRRRVAALESPLGTEPPMDPETAARILAAFEPPAPRIIPDVDLPPVSGESPNG